ncbi:MAG TPA: hypothetical protein PL041_02890 [Melioribacteraceae bacterium]|nr:hypothetical protein [Melioribacteraceae bacterium]
MLKSKLIKLSWILGWFGSFSWIYGFTIYFIINLHFLASLIGIFISLLSLICIIKFAPWKFPQTKYYYLIIPCFILLVFSIFWAIYFIQPITKEEFSPLWFSWLLFFILPIISIGKKTWENNNFN